MKKELSNNTELSKLFESICVKMYKKKSIDEIVKFVYHESLYCFGLIQLQPTDLEWNLCLEILQTEYFNHKRVFNYLLKTGHLYIPKKLYLEAALKVYQKNGNKGYDSDGLLRTELKYKKSQVKYGAKYEQVSDVTDNSWKIFFKIVEKGDFVLTPRDLLKIFFVKGSFNVRSLSPMYVLVTNNVPIKFMKRLITIHDNIDKTQYDYIDCFNQVLDNLLTMYTKTRLYRSKKTLKELSALKKTLIELLNRHKPNGRTMYCNLLTKLYNNNFGPDLTSIVTDILETYSDNKEDYNDVKTLIRTHEFNEDYKAGGKDFLLNQAKKNFLNNY